MRVLREFCIFSSAIVRQNSRMVSRDLAVNFCGRTYVIAAHLTFL